MSRIFKTNLVARLLSLGLLSLGLLSSTTGCLSESADTENFEYVDSPIVQDGFEIGGEDIGDDQSNPEPQPWHNEGDDERDDMPAAFNVGTGDEENPEPQPWAEAAEQANPEPQPWQPNPEGEDDDCDEGTEPNPVPWLGARDDRLSLD